MFDLLHSARAQVCVLCVQVCLVSWSPASWSCHPFASAVTWKENSSCPPRSLYFSISHFPRSTGQSWEINRNKLSAPQAESLLQKKKVEAGGEARERWSGGEMELDRWSSANKNSSDSWKQLIWLTISTNLNSAIEIFFYAKHVVIIHRERQVFGIYTHIKVNTDIMHMVERQQAIGKHNESQCGKAG